MLPTGHNLRSHKVAGIAEAIAAEGRNSSIYRLTAPI